MNVTSSPLNVKVFLDSGYIGEAPAVFPEIASGTYTIDFRKDGYESVSKTVTIIEGKTTNVMVVLRFIPPDSTEQNSSFPAFIWAFVIIALIAIVGGGYYFWSQKKKSEVMGDEESEKESE
jgi:hypothetical protein